PQSSHPTTLTGAQGSGNKVTAVIAWGKRPVPFRTRKLRPTAPMVLHPGGCGRVGHRRTHIRSRPPNPPRVGGSPTLTPRPATARAGKPTQRRTPLAREELRQLCDELVGRLVGAIVPEPGEDGVARAGQDVGDLAARHTEVGGALLTHHDQRFKGQLQERLGGHIRSYHCPFFSGSPRHPFPPLLAPGCA